MGAQESFCEGDNVRHREFNSEQVGEIVAIYPLDHEADVLWPWSRGKADAALMKLSDLVKV